MVGIDHPGAPLTTSENWITFDGSKVAWYNAPGDPLTVRTTQVPPAGPGLPPWTAWYTATYPKTAYDVLASLPADPKRLLAEIDKQLASQALKDSGITSPWSPGGPETQAQHEFDYLMLILWNAAAGVGGPPAAEAAVYRALATLPGIWVGQGITVETGARAIAVSDSGYAQLLLDPLTYQVIGLRTLSPGSAPNVAVKVPANSRITQRIRVPLKPLYPMPPKGALLQIFLYTQVTEVPAQHTPNHDRVPLPPENDY
jgi:hypothetical protein